MNKIPYLTDLVTIPVLDAASATTLLHRLLTVAATIKKLPPRIEQARKLLAAALANLQAALKARLSAGSGDTQRAKQADRAIDVAFSALYDFLTAFSKLPEGTPQRDSAQALLNVLFADGLRFTILSYVKEWAEASARLQRIADDKLDAPIKALGGEVFLKNLAAAHKEYGEALGITSAKAATPTVSTVAEPLTEAKEALRKYLLQVSAHADDTDPTTTELTEALLAPIAEWQSPTRKASSEDAPVTPAADPQAPPIS